MCLRLEQCSAMLTSGYCVCVVLQVMGDADKLKSWLDKKEAEQKK